MAEVDLPVDCMLACCDVPPQAAYSGGYCVDYKELFPCWLPLSSPPPPPQAAYSGWYCVDCEEYKDEKELLMDDKEPEQSHKCPTHR